MRAEFTVFAKDYPETRLLVEVQDRDLANPEQDPNVQRLARAVWGANCHFGLLVTPTSTYVLRDNFETSGPASIRVVDVIPTAVLLSRVARVGGESISGERLEFLTERWLERLTKDYDTALPEHPVVVRAFFPEIVGAVAEGRVVAGVPV